MKILFLCKANMFRSQMAQAWYNHLSNKNKAKSGALICHEGELSWLVTDSGREFGLDLSKQHSKDVNKKMLKEADILIIMNKNLMPNFDIHRKSLKKNVIIEVWNIEDIIVKDSNKNIYPEFVKTCKFIGEKVKNLVSKYG